MYNVKLIDQDNNEFTIEELGSAQGFEFPEIRSSIVDVAGARSAVYITSKAGKRTLSFRGVISTNVPTNRRLLEKVSRPGSLKTLRFTTCDDLELETYVDIVSLVSPYKEGRVAYQLEAVAPDWRFYGQTQKSMQTIEYQVIGGTGIPATIPLGMTTAQLPNVSNIVENSGNEESHPMFRIDGPITSFRIQNFTTDEDIVITYTLTSSQYLEIDTLNRTIKLNGSTDVYSALTSGDFWTLIPGENNIKFLPNGTDENTLLTVTWQDAYIGI